MDIANIILQAHKGFGYLILVLAAVFVIALLMTMFGYSGRISKLLRKSTLFTMIFFHIQFLIGLIMLFGTSGFMNTIKEIGMGGLMKNGDLRFTYIEHPTSMLIAAILMTVVNKKVKTNEKLNSGIVIMGIIAVLLFCFAFPWTRVFGG